ncbi:capsid protein [Vibrio rotiferianus]|uniref:GPO family capsid scaffolding protein n=1 Tax=Vibrio rotiferianus TaxID=190895 RepID=UPI00111075AA|nr:GPO family capsid scaffolding protein [Vibrio rotiferianus]TMX39747.1 capsid protein [Vibrio rotiferianus]TMX57856.1 capsid protein [Vibrio rotiferianus]TMX59145.1 capsid protein [Vibrio rotiferianus]
MAKTSDWKIVATEGATVDKRIISATWIKDMAETYSHDQSTALIWPEHYKGDTPWGPYEGKNWGVVEELKAEKRAGKLRLLAKLTPNNYLLSANKDGQKLFTSIEPDPDYLGTGRCYLRGLAVTDKPASTGTTRLQFSTAEGEEVTREVSHLEELDFSECQPKSNPLSNFFSALANLAKHGELPNEINQSESTPSEEEEEMNPEQFSQLMGKLDGIESKQNAQETKINDLAGKVEEFSAIDEKPDENNDQTHSFSVQQFSEELQKQLSPVTEQVKDLQTQFAELKQEKPGQKPGDEGSGGEEKFSSMGVF